MLLKCCFKHSFLLVSCISVMQMPVNAQALAADSASIKMFETNIRMDDGMLLSTRVFLPDTNKVYPAVLIRTPYNKELEMWIDKRLLSKNIAIVIQDVRGKYKSEGKFYPFVNERGDGLATLRWIRNQPWSNRKVGGWGVSYMGYTQWIIADSLDAAAPLFTSPGMYDFVYPDKLLSLQSAFLWGYANDTKAGNDLSAANVKTRMSRLPLSLAADSINFLLDWLQHEKKDDYWNKQEFHGTIASPVISIAGWYDIFLKGQIKSFQQLSSTGNAQNRYVIGPWAHGVYSYKNDYGGSSRTGSYGEMAFEYMVGVLNGTSKILPAPLKDATFNLFIMEKNEYVGSSVWPPKEAKMVPYFLQSDRSLGIQKPVKAKSFVYTYNPADPYPNYGGTFLGDSVGPALQNKNLGRPDQVSFETPVLKVPLILLGPVTASLWLSSTAPCTDFIVSIQDVFPDGKIINIQDGAAKISFTTPSPGKYPLSIWATGYQVNTGHRLRVIITSSLYPRFNRSLNTCEPIFSAKSLHEATQRIYTGAKTPSCVFLPVYSINNK